MSAAEDRRGTFQPRQSSGVRRHVRKDIAAKQAKLTPATLPGEVIREQQIKAREEREARRATMDGRHEYILAIVADQLGISLEDAEEFMLDSDQLTAFNNFFVVGGRRALIFFYKPPTEQDLSLPPAKSTASYKANGRRFWITDGTKDEYTGSCHFFVRLDNKKLISMMNIHQDTYFGSLESHGDGLLGAVERLLSNVFIPALTNCKQWGELSGPEGQSIQNNFLRKLSSFVAVLANARASIADAVTLTPCTNPALVNITSTDVMTAANNMDMVEAAEKCVQSWCKEIEQILTQSEQMRKESDDVGPQVELDYWKKRMAKFDSLITSIKQPKCRVIINILVASKSKVLQFWKDLDSTITDFTNEAKDNVKFLYTLEKYCEPLYKCNPVSMLDSIPGLINAVRMINSYSRYYNTSERMTALFVKVTNQMITACKAHVTDSGYQKLWDQDRAVVLKKLADCKKLNDEYQQCFQRMKERLKEHPEEKPFDFSEMYMFGKFNNFIKRCEKVEEMLNIIETYSVLGLSHIEGIEVLNNRFQLIITAMRKKPYDLLDQRKSEFDVDFEEFKRLTQDILEQLQQLLNTRFASMSTTRMATDLVRRFERLNIPGLKIEKKYIQLITRFESDMDKVHKEYNEQKDDPPLPRNCPSTSGRISWSRQLYRRIATPMGIFQKNVRLMGLPETKKAIKRYNKLAKVLVEYEIVFLDIWIKQIDSAKNSLNSTVLVRHPKTKELLVNFDKQILETLRDIQVLTGMGVEVSANGQILYTQRESLKRKLDSVTFLVSENKRVREKILDILKSLMELHFDKLDRTISPGLTLICWSSINLTAFIDSTKRALEELELLMDRVINMHKHRILVALKDIQEIALCYIPECGTLTITEFCNTTEELCSTASSTVDLKSQVVERVITEMIITLIGPDVKKEIILDKGKPGYRARVRRHEQELHLEQEALNLGRIYEQMLVDVQIKLLRSTLENIRRRLAVKMVSYGETRNEKSNNPLFEADLILAIPDIIMVPSLDDIQKGLNTAITSILNITKSVFRWGQQRDRLYPSDSVLIRYHRLDVKNRTQTVQMTVDTPCLKNFYRMVSEHKEIQKLVSAISTAVNATKTLKNTATRQFTKYSHLWTKERKAKMKNFMKTMDPTVNEFRTEMDDYSKLVEEILMEPEIVHAGPVALNTEKLKLAFTTEAKAWVVAYGRTMNTKYQSVMENVFKSIDDWSKRLGHPLNDLDDIRGVMKALKEIREHEIRIDTSIDPVEESYALMHTHQIKVPHEDMERVDTLRYIWNKLHQQVAALQTTLLKVQPKFRTELLENVTFYHDHVKRFTQDYNINGPMVVGIPPREASDKLVIFQARFDELWSKYQTYTGGEELFGLTVTDYPDILHIRKELSLLQKLYNLYTLVMDSIDGYFEILWTEVEIDKINNELMDFQNKCRKLPKGLKEWQAFNDLKKKIDNFSELCPLLERMLDRSMKDRHWKRIEEVTKWKFDVDSEGFVLRNVMEAPLLKYMEDIEDICISAVKEKDIESKLKQISAEWAVQNLSFSNFKVRGELLIRGDDTQEIIGLMEDSLMVLGSLMSNRYNAPFKKDIQTWIKNLTDATEILENWLIVQNLWVVP